ncbi:TBC1 domain family member 23-like [Watersipora subatra]|uniref:TBC1 domain family member 23-like n=1 Tax=Watersipora subatra TaxID=2589382 RepID=UPI00355B7E6C
MDKRKAPLYTRESTAQLMALDSTGGVDERSEIGSTLTLDDIISRKNTKFHCDCEQVKDNEQFIPSHLVITDKHLYILRMTEVEHRYIVKLRRKISTILRITKKAKMPDVIKLEYGSRERTGEHVTDTDKLNIPRKADAVIRILKHIRVSPVRE